MGALWHEKINNRGRTNGRRTEQGEPDGPCYVLVASTESWGFLPVFTRNYLRGFFVSGLTSSPNVSKNIICDYTNLDRANIKRKLQKKPTGWSEIQLPLRGSS